MKFKEKLETIDLTLRLLEKSKFHLLEKDHGNYQKDLDLASKAIKMLEDQLWKEVKERADKEKIKNA